MTNFPPFPWRYLRAVLDSRESFLETSIAFTKAEFVHETQSCPRCGRRPNDLTWVPVSIADENWFRGKGGSGFLTCCLDCKQQIDFFVDDELTRIESEVRALGTSTQELPWSESEPVF